MNNTEHPPGTPVNVTFVQISSDRALDAQGRVWIYRASRRTWYLIEEDLGESVFLGP